MTTDNSSSRFNFRNENYTAKHTHIRRVSENSRPHLFFFEITSATVNQFLYLFHRLI